ncbi:PfkB family carbohydrate kinase [Phenylobacterium sp. J426]|uniref:PfkB family carbohydrate kinase n=1 Tax=Phenylobacterium sp. J426 TaxID=2898439 RepID=UPI002150DB97|nr:PfkB family carbohydrate kinase [Phenylobacterium sp. J426]MCR5873823.1 PfkB family carbohydrate kinase [Phenylobacterium sp. J426]
MPLALVLSSFVAASRIGGGAQQYVLAAHKIDPVLAPTVMFGRSPAKGAQGEVTSPEVLARMLADIEADAVFGLVDLVVTGHFSLPEQVEIAAGVLERVRAANREGAYADRPVVVVDPVMGDLPKGLYVRPEVAEVLARRLVPVADWITPNVWELSHLTGRPVRDAAEAVAAARALGKGALVTSVPMAQDEIGLLFVTPETAVLFSHQKVERMPNGTGDLVAASFGAGLVEGLAPEAAAHRAARAAAETVEATLAWRAQELPIVALADRLVSPRAEVRIQRL